MANHSSIHTCRTFRTVRSCNSSHIPELRQEHQCIAYQCIFLNIHIVICQVARLRAKGLIDLYFPFMAEVNVVACELASFLKTVFQNYYNDVQYIESIAFINF